MSKYHKIKKDELEYLAFDESDNTLTIKWWVGGSENAVNGLVLKVELIEKLITDYKAPDIKYDPNYDHPF